ncbi:hypothetical protein GCM10011607_37530 [Shewanella inventionis]|uniref:DUF3149 domain-containing protein n=2 Tax=Shewanellaceae TaxID=267890 RepID=A0ABQ1JSI3_9GAMM|nr:hypothetical protein GCM10011607_37530 [Shewanella inventionis]
MISEFLSYDLALFSIGIVIIGALTLGIYYIIIFHSFKAKQAEDKDEQSMK